MVTIGTMTIGITTHILRAGVGQILIELDTKKKSSTKVEEKKGTTKPIEEGIRVKAGAPVGTGGICETERKEGKRGAGV